jgi:hypothetical protein
MRAVDRIAPVDRAQVAEEVDHGDSVRSAR